MSVSGEQVRIAMILANITRVDHHECGLCKEIVFYERVGQELYFHPACGCSWTPPEPELRSWASAAEWINMQSQIEWRNKLRAKFGLGAEEDDE